MLGGDLMATITARVLMLTVSVVLLAGCGGARRSWIKAGATEEQFQRDSYECASQSTYTSRRAGLGGGGGFYREGTAVNEDLYRACLRSRGFIRQTEQQGWRGIE